MKKEMLRRSSQLNTQIRHALQKESLKKIDACWGSYVYHRLAKFQGFLILATLTRHPSPLTPHPSLLTRSPHPSPLTPYSQLYKKGNGTAGSFSIVEQQQFPGSVLP